MLLTYLVNNIFAANEDLDISFKDKKDHKIFNTRILRIRKFGAVRSSLIGRRLDDLHAADTLADMRTVPGRCHELREDRKGTFCVDLDGPYRLIFKPANNPVPLKPDGGINWSGVSAIIILAVENTHE